jgi:hypothetical protein
MNNRQGISSWILILAVLFTGTITGCKSGGKKAVKEEIAVSVPADSLKLKDLQKAEKIFRALPSPLESAMLIKSTGARFNADLLNPVSNTSKYVSNRSMALNLGIYTCDLSFASLYEQTQLIINYMNAAKKMADGLNILKAIDQSTIDRLEENINDSEVIMEIVSESFMNSNSYLEDNGQNATAAVVLAGGWFEGLYLSTILVDPNKFMGNKLVDRIIDQKLTINILLDLLNDNKGDAVVDELLTQVQKLKVIFDKVSISSSKVSAEYSKESNTTTLKSDVTKNMTPEVFKELAATVAEIRASFVK